MKTLKTLFLGLSLMTIYYACSPMLSLDTGTATLSKKLNYIAANWEEMDTQQDPNSICYSYVPEVGVRARYVRAQPELGLFVVESIVGQKAFLKGPHVQGFDCSSATSFGHYNPAFLKRLQKVVKLTFSNKRFTDSFQPMYDAELKSYLRTFYLSYEAGTRDKAIQSNYQKHLNPVKRDEDAGIYLQESFRGYADEMEQKGYDWYESNTCAAFWVRRSIDGTADEFYALLKSAMEVFDPAFVQS